MTCKGKNCNSNGKTPHSSECRFEYAANVASGVKGFTMPSRTTDHIATLEAMIAEGSVYAGSQVEVAIRAAIDLMRGQSWQPVAGYEGLYEVSSDGHVRSADGRILGQWPNTDGYLLVRLTKDGQRAMARVHRLVADAFVPNPDGLPFVNHLDNTRDNNRARNLEWCTQAENLHHMTEQGRRGKPMLGKRSPVASLTDEQAAWARTMHASGAWTNKAIAHSLGVSRRTIGRLLSGKTYTAPPKDAADEQ